MQQDAEPNTPTVEPGEMVYDNAGVELGRVHSVGAGYMHIQKGIIFTKDLYVPLAGVVSINGDNVTVSVAKAQIEAADWYNATAADFASGGKYATPDQPNAPTTTGGDTTTAPGLGTTASGPTTAEQRQAAKRFVYHDENYADPVDGDRPGDESLP